MAKEPYVTFDVPARQGLDGIRLNDDGSIAFLDKAGQELHLEGVKRLVMHERPHKTPKVRSRQAMQGSKLSIDGLGELCDFHDVFVIDTAYSYYPLARRRAVACALRVRFLPEGKHIRLCADDRLIIYDLLDFEGNPERAAMLALTEEFTQSLGDLAMRRAVVNDSDLSQHEAINERATPLYGTMQLPAPFTLLYAGDIGGEALNRVLRFCDAQSKEILRALVSGDAPTPPHYLRMANAGALQVGRLARTDVQVSNTLLGRVTGFPEYATLTLHGDDGREETIQLEIPKPR